MKVFQALSFMCTIATFTSEQGSVVSAMKPPRGYSGVISSVMMRREEGAGSTSVVDGTMIKNPLGDNELLVKSTDDDGSANPNGVPSDNGSVVHDLEEDFFIDENDADIILQPSSTPIRDGMGNDPAATHRGLQNSDYPCEALGAVDFRLKINEYVSSCTDENSCTSTLGYPINQWCTSKITDMSKAFNDSPGFNEDISAWDVSSVTTMLYMFAHGTKHYFNQDISGWNTSSVINMYNMFAQAKDFNQDIGRWDTSSVTRMDTMFYGASVFNGDISGWNTQSLMTSSSMFSGASKFNQDLCAWDTSQLNSAAQMFYLASSFNQNLCAWRYTFPYAIPYKISSIFLQSNCAHPATPTAGIQGPFCASDCTQPSICRMTTNVPGASGPAHAPTGTTLAPTSAPWLIKFTNMTANFNFTAGSTNEDLVLTYEIGKGRDHASSLYAGLCLDSRQTIDAGVVIKNTSQIENSTTPAMSTLKLRYDFDTSLIASSNIWNNATNKVELCYVVQLLHPRARPQEDLVIQEDIRNLTIDFDFLVDFALDAGLDDATVYNASDEAKLDDYIDAYNCEGGNTMDELVEGAELAPNEDLHVCFVSKSVDIEITEITTMVIAGTDAGGNPRQLEVMADGHASFPSITSFRFVNTTSVVCTTRVPINLFDYERNNAKVAVEGSLSLNLQGAVRERKLMIASGATTKYRNLQEPDGVVNEKALFDVSVNLKSGESAEGEEISMVNSADDARVVVGYKGIVVVGKAFVVAYAIW